VAEFRISDGCLGHDCSAALQVTPWHKDYVSNTHLPMRMDRSLLPKSTTWEMLSLVNPFCPGPRFLLPCTMVNFQCPEAILYEPPYVSTATYLDQEEFHSTRALVYARLHLPS
jgi:hypothetical protein